MKSLAPLLKSYSHPFQVLTSRKLLYYVSNPKLLDSTQSLLPVSPSTSVYIGMDPTADSIHLGNLLGLIVLTHLRVAGLSPIVVLGGATGLIGDPSGRNTERK